MKEMPKILITGAGGFIGRYAVKHFLKNKWEVFAVIRSAKKGFFKDIRSEHFHEILCDLESIDRLVADVGQIDVFLHLAWSGLERSAIDDASVQTLNQQMSIDCAKAALRLKCKVFMDGGSRAEYGNTSEPMHEKMECCPITSYGKAKLAAHSKIKDVFRGENISYYHLRIFSVYGRGDHPWSLMSTLTRDLAAGKEVVLSPCLHDWNFMHIEDAAAAICRIAWRGVQMKGQESEIVNIASKDTRHLYEFVHAVHQCLGGKGTLVFGPFPQGKEAMLSVVPDVTHMYELIPEYQESHIFEEEVELLVE